MRTTALTHIAMSVPMGSLTAEARLQILAFYGAAFGWFELDALSTDERLTIAVGDGCYVNVREHPSHHELSYEHFGVQVASVREVEDLFDLVSDLGGDPEPLQSRRGYASFRFQHLLPMPIEVQHIPPAIV